MAWTLASPGQGRQRCRNLLRGHGDGNTCSCARLRSASTVRRSLRRHPVRHSYLRETIAGFWRTLCCFVDVFRVSRTHDPGGRSPTDRQRWWSLLAGAFPFAAFMDAEVQLTTSLRLPLTTSSQPTIPHWLLRDRYGYAHFDSLYIKEAGIDYVLGFTATGLTSTFSGDTYIESSMFTVGVGPPYRLELENDILRGAIVSGSPFEEQVSGPDTGV